MLENVSKSNAIVFQSDMDDGGRRLLDVINDPQLLQSFLDNSTSNTAAIKNEIPPTATALPIVVATTIESPPVKKEVKAKKSGFVATKSSPIANDRNSGSKQTIVVPGGGIILDGKQTINLGAAGMIGNTLPNTQTINIQQPFSSLHSSALNSNSGNLCVPASNVFQPTQFQIGARSMTVLPQQLQIVPGLQMGQSSGLSQFLFTSRPPLNQQPQAIQPGQMLQIIQTSHGTQILPTNSATSMQPIFTSSTSTNKVTSTNSRLANKQILPKPLCTSAVSNTSTKSNSSKATNIKLISQQVASNAFNAQPLATPANLGNTHQFVIGSGSQPIITGPHGTFLLNNNILQNIGGSQPFLIQGSMPNALQNQVQLSIRPQTPLFVNSNSLTNDQANISFTLPNNAQIATSKSQSQPNQPQTFVFSSSSGSTATSSNNILMAPNIRPNAPSNIIFRQPFLEAQQTVPNQPQFIQIQTANGPILVALNQPTSQIAPQPPPRQQPPPTPQTIINQPTAANTPSSIQIGNTLFSLTANPSLNLQSTVHPLPTILTQPQDGSTTIANTNIIKPNIAASINTPTPLFINSPVSVLSKSQPTTVCTSSASNSIAQRQTQKATSTKGLNLADLLKETGILPEFSPPSSPKNSDNTDLSISQSTQIPIEPAPQPLSTPSSQSSTVMVPNEPKSTENLPFPSNAIAPPQLRFSIGSDGTLVLLSPNSNSLPAGIVQVPTKYDIGFKDPNGIGSSQPSPDSTTPSIEASTNSPTSISQPISSLNTVTAGTIDNIDYTTTKPLDPLSDQSFLEDSKSLSSIINGDIDTFTHLPVQQNSEQNAAVSKESIISNTFGCDTSKVSTSCGDTLHLAASISVTASQQPKTVPNLVQSNSGNNSATSMAQFNTVVTSIDTSIAPITFNVDSNNKEFIDRLDNRLEVLENIKNSSVQQRDLLRELTEIKRKLQQSQNTSLTIDLSFEAQKLLQIASSFANYPQIPPTKDDHICEPAIIDESSIKQESDVNQNILIRINEPLLREQKAIDETDCLTQFRSTTDAWQRLLPFHLCDTSAVNNDDLSEYDDLYEKISIMLLHKKLQLYNRFSQLMLREGMRDSSPCEHVMLNRRFLREETDALRSHRELVASGQSLDLPPIPESWRNLNFEDISLKRKLPTDDDFEDYFDQTPREEISDICSMLEEDQNNLSNDDDLNIEPNNLLSGILPNDSNESQDITAVDVLLEHLKEDEAVGIEDPQLFSSSEQMLFDSLESEPLNNSSSSGLNIAADDLEALYSDIQADDPLDHGSDLPWPSSMDCIDTVTNQVSNDLLPSQEQEQSNRSVPWNNPFGVAQTEADVAVQSIMNSSDESLKNLSVDLSSIDELDDNIIGEGSVHFGVSRDEATDSLFIDTETLDTQQQGFDVQMHCAIKSIMMQSPTEVAPNSSKSTHFNTYPPYMSTSMSSSSGYNNLGYHMSSHQMMSNNMRPSSMMSYQSSGVSDSLLDEAVRSISFSMQDNDAS